MIDRWPINKEQMKEDVLKELEDEQIEEGNYSFTLQPTESWNITHYSQPYECSTKIGAEVDSKGNIKPTAQVTISRKFEDGNEIVDCIHADVSRGIEEVTEAITEILEKFREN